MYGIINSRQGGANMEVSMKAFEDRKKGHESKFAFDAEMKFKAEMRRNRLLAEWAGKKMGMDADQIDAYAKDVRRADLAEKGHDDVLRKVKADLVAKGVSVDDAELHKMIDDFTRQAEKELASGGA